MFKKLYFVLILGAAMACHAAPSKLIKVDGSNDLKPDTRQEIVLKEVAELLLKYDYKKVEMNDSLSTVIFNTYIKNSIRIIATFWLLTSRILKNIKPFWMMIYRQAT